MLIEAGGAENGDDVGTRFQETDVVRSALFMVAHLLLFPDIVPSSIPRCCFLSMFFPPSPVGRHFLLLCLWSGLSTLTPSRYSFDCFLSPCFLDIAF